MKKEGMKKNWVPVTIYLLGVQNIHRLPMLELIEAASRLRFCISYGRGHVRKTQMIENIVCLKTVRLLDSGFR